jgi:hypothetical protein
MKHIVKLLMVTFLLSSVGLVYAQGPVDKTKDETVKVKSGGNLSNEKGGKGSNAGRLGDDTDAPTKDSGDETAVEGKKSFFGRLFGGKSAPEGHSSKAAASSRGGSAKTAGDKNDSGSKISNAPVQEGDKEKAEKPQGDGGD